MRTGEIRRVGIPRNVRLVEGKVFFDLGVVHVIHYRGEDHEYIQQAARDRQKITAYGDPNRFATRGRKYFCTEMLSYRLGR